MSPASPGAKPVLPSHHGGAASNPSVSSFWEALGTKPLPVGRVLPGSDICPGCCRGKTSEGGQDLWGQARVVP